MADHYQLTPEFMGRLIERVNEILANTDTVERQIKRLRKREQVAANLLDLAEIHPSADVLQRLREREQQRDLAKHALERLETQAK
jgi:RNA polymerase-interacting CarD/CdnL/TRCF family regulator